jgi:ATP-dependent DNA helicase RecG
VLRDEKVIVEAREIARALIAEDPFLTHVPALASEVAQLRAEEAASYLDKG